MPNAHSNLGPSGAKKWINCAASVAMEQAVVEKDGKEPTSYAAAEGTVAHVPAEEYASGKLTYDELCAKIGTTLMQEGHEVEFIEEMVNGAVDYKEAIDRARQDFANRPDRSKVVERFEDKVKADKSIDKMVWGTADFYIYCKGDVLYVIDYKFGRRYVSPKENEQLGCYAAGVMDTIGCWAFRKVILGIVQPRKIGGGEASEEWETTTDWVAKFAGRARAAAFETRNPNAQPVAGAWCHANFCKAIGSCPAYAGQRKTEAQNDFPVVAKDMNAKKLPSVELLTTEEKARYLTYEDDFEAFFGAIRTSLTAQAEGGEVVPYFKLVQGKANRKWRTDSAVEAAYGDVLGDKIFVDRKLKSPNQLEKMLRLKPDATAHLWEKPPGKKKLAPDSDPRKACVTTSAQDDFDVAAKLTGVRAAIAGIASASVPEILAAVEPQPDDGCPMCAAGACLDHAVARPVAEGDNELLKELAGPTGSAVPTGSAGTTEKVWPS